MRRQGPCATPYAGMLVSCDAKTRPCPTPYAGMLVACDAKTRPLPHSVCWDVSGMWCEDKAPAPLRMLGCFAWHPSSSIQLWWWLSSSASSCTTLINWKLSFTLRRFFRLPTGNMSHISPLVFSISMFFPPWAYISYKTTCTLAFALLRILKTFYAMMLFTVFALK